MQKARTGTKASVFRTAVALLNRSWAEVGAGDLAPFVDERTMAEHNLAADVVDVLDARGRFHGWLRIEDGLLLGGAFAYGHPDREAAANGDERRGVSVDGRRVESLADL